MTETKQGAQISGYLKDRASALRQMAQVKSASGVEALTHVIRGHLLVVHDHTSVACMCGWGGKYGHEHDTHVAEVLLASPAMAEHDRQVRVEAFREVADEISAAHGPGSSGWVNMRRGRADREASADA